MAYFPFFIDIENKKCVVFGGGIVALRKIEKLMLFGCNITAVALDFIDEIKDIKNIKLIKSEFELRYIDGAFIVIAATDEPYVNSRISLICRSRGIHINSVDVKEGCSFIFPSLYKNGSICIGISTEGKSPYVAKELRKYVDNAIPPYMANIAEVLGNVRDMVKSSVHIQGKREIVFARVFDVLSKNEGSISYKEVESIIRQVNENEN